MAEVVVFANHKGGCGKTTSTSNIGAAMASRPFSKRVLIIDTDPQSNLSEIFGCDDPDMGGTRVEDALDDDRIDGPPQVWTSRQTADGPVELAAGVHLLPCTESLAAVVFKRMGEPDFPGRLRVLCELYDDSYDVILIDTPPGVQPLSTMALLAADWVVVPFRPSDSEVGGAMKLVRLVEEELSDVNPGLRVMGTLMIDTDDRLLIDRDSRAVLQQAGIPLFARSVPRAVRVRMAPRYMAPMVVTEPSSRVGRAYSDVADEMLKAFGAARSAA